MKLSNNIAYFFRKWKRKLTYRTKSFFWYYRCKIFHPYNVLKIKTLPPTYVDEDILLLHACMHVLELYMQQVDWNWRDFEFTTEDECGMTREEWVEYIGPYKDFAREIQEVWDWWQEYQKLEKSNSPDTHDRFFELEQKENWALQTIIKWRDHLWT